MLTCYNPCRAAPTEPLPTNNYAVPCCAGGGGANLDFDDSDTISFSGVGTALDPIVADMVLPQIITFEIAPGKLTSMGTGDIIAPYAPSKEFVIPAAMSGSQFQCLGQSGEVAFDLKKNGTTFGHVSIVGGIPTATLASDTSFTAGDLLTFVATTSATFSLLAITIQGLRSFDYVA